VWTWIAKAWDWLSGWFTRQEAKRDADDARMRLNMDFILQKYQDRVTDQANRITVLETEQRSQAKEMMRLQVSRARCEAETEAQKRQIEGLVRELAALKAKGEG
jgi:hypothetical protein